MNSEIFRYLHFHEIENEWTFWNAQMETEIIHRKACISTESEFVRLLFRLSLNFCTSINQNFYSFEDDVPIIIVFILNFNHMSKQNFVVSARIHWGCFKYHQPPIYILSLLLLYCRIACIFHVLTGHPPKNTNRLHRKTYYMCWERANR